MRRDPVVAVDMLGVVLDALADRIAARIGETRERETYTSVELPPHTTRRRFAELCRSGRVVGAHREGVTWICSRKAWDAARRRPASDRTAPSSTELGDKTVRARKLLAAAGLRVVKGER